MGRLIGRPRPPRANEGHMWPSFFLIPEQVEQMKVTRDLISHFVQNSTFPQSSLQTRTKPATTPPMKYGYPATKQNDHGHPQPTTSCVHH
jgi:hypothetical protein